MTIIADPPSYEPRRGGRVSDLRARAVQRPVLMVWFGTAVFSTGPVMIAAASVSGPVFSFWRLWIGSVLLGALAAGSHLRQRGTGGTRITAPGVWWTAAAGVGFAIHQVMFIVALRVTSVVDVTLMNTLAPLVVALLAVPLFGERPGAGFRLWSVLAISGAAMVAVAGSSGAHGQPVGIALAAGNVVFYSLFFVSSKQAREHVDTMAFLAGATFVAALVVTCAVIAFGLAIGDISAHDMLLCLAVAALPGLLGHFSVTWSLKWVPANIPPVIMLSIPVLSGVMAWALLGQGVSALKIVGGLITLVGVGGAVHSPGARSLVIEAMDLAEES